MINLFDRIKYSDKSDQSNGLLKARSAEHERWLTSFSRFSCCLNYILFKWHILRYILSVFLTAAALSTLSAKREQDKITNNQQFIWGHLVGWGGGGWQLIPDAVNILVQAPIILNKICCGVFLLVLLKGVYLPPIQ